MKVGVVLSANLHEIANAVSIVLEVLSECTVRGLLTGLNDGGEVLIATDRIRLTSYVPS